VRGFRPNSNGDGDLNSDQCLGRIRYHNFARVELVDNDWVFVCLGAFPGHVMVVNHRCHPKTRPLPGYGRGRTWRRHVHRFAPTVVEGFTLGHKYVLAGASLGKAV